ncbi:MAG: PGF-CTERM-anchored ABC transporter substrate-binding protein [Haloarculaceae archaeon]
MREAVAPILVVLTLTVSIAAVPVGVGAQSDQPAQCSFPVSATDASGVTVSIDEEPQEVVVLQPSAAQTMWEIGAEEKVVGMPVNPYTAYLNGTTDRTDVVGEQSTVIQSEVVNLQPDLVLAPNVTDPATVESLRNAGLTVFYFEEAESIDDIYEKTELTGRLVGEFEGAADRTAEMRATVDAIRSAVNDRESPTVYYALGGGYTAGTETFIHELITTAGGENVADGEFAGYQVLSPEILTQKDPDWIVVPGDRSLEKNDAINRTTAVRDNQIVRVEDNYMNQAGPRTVTPLQRMAEAFHPDANVTSAVENADPAAPTQCASATGDGTPERGTSAETGQTADTGTPSSDTATGPSETPTASPVGTPSASGAGFGTFVAVLAVVAVALWLGRSRR